MSRYLPEGWRMGMGGWREGASFLPKGWRVTMEEWREDSTYVPKGWRMEMGGWRKDRSYMPKGTMTSTRSIVVRRAMMKGLTTSQWRRTWLLLEWKESLGSC